MTENPCPREAEVIAAVRDGRVSDELREHAVECASCREVVLVAGFMTRGAEQLAELGPLPDAGYIWWRAHLEHRELQARRATGVISVFQRIAVVAGAVAVVLLLRGALPELGAWLAGAAASARTSALPDNMASPILVVLVSLGLLAAPSVFNLYETWSRD
jgi:hypothetical protein